MSGPTFSVCVAAYNAARTIETTIRSVLGQTRSDLELIVVDDGSTDRTPELVEAHARSDDRLRLLRQPNAGTAAARNTGLARASGHYVSFLDHDDAWLPGFLTATAEAFEREPGAGLAFTDAWIVDDASGLVHPRTALGLIPPGILAAGGGPSRNRALAALLRVNFITTCTATISRAALERVGRLDPSIRGCDDWDLWLRVLGAGFRAVAIPGAHAVLRKRADSQGSDEAMMASGSRLALERALARRLPTPEAEREAGLHLALLERELGARRRESRPGILWWKLRRRHGRRRLRPMRMARWRRPPTEVREVLGL